MTECKFICSCLQEEISYKNIELSTHSVFQSAINFQSEIGMVTILWPEKGVQPYSVVLENPYCFAMLRDKLLIMSAEGITQGGNLIISFEKAQTKRLTLKNKPVWNKEAAGKIHCFLKDHVDKGITELAFGQRTNIVTHFLFSRVEQLRSAVRAKEEMDIIKAAENMAGCGAGLTPSSDDFLCGYLAGMPDLGIPGLTEKIAKVVSLHTNDISAALLCRAGMGLFSYDILQLINCLEANKSKQETDLALKRVAEFGSSSGCDFLTGLYFSIADYYENGGI